MTGIRTEAPRTEILKTLFEDSDKEEDGCQLRRSGGCHVLRIKPISAALLSLSFVAFSV